MAWKGAKIGVGYRIDIPASECEIELSTGLPPYVKDRHGTRQGRLAAEAFAGFQVHRKRGNKIAVWQCVCDCGNRINVFMGPSKTLPRSCGCWHREYHTHHGASGDTASPAERKTHAVWTHLLQQSYNSSSFNRPSRSGREIKMHEPWLEDFRAFLEDVGFPPTLDHVLTRIDFDKDFEPSNLRWVHKEENSKRIITHINQFKPSALLMSYEDELIKLVETYPDATAVEYCKLLANATGIKVSESAIRRSLKNLQNLGLVIARNKTWMPPYKDELIKLVETYPDATAVEYCKLLASATGIKVSESAMHNSFKKLGLVLARRKIHILSYEDELTKLVEKHPGATAAEYCELFANATGRQVGQSTIYRIFKKLGLVITARKKVRMPPYKNELIKLIEKHPDASAAEYCKRIAEATGIKVSESAMRRCFKKLDLVMAPNKVRMSLYKDVLIKLVEDYPDVTAAEYRKLFANATGIRASESAIYRNIKKLGLSQP